MENFAELTQRLLVIQSGGRPKSSVIAKLDGLPTRKPVRIAELRTENDDRGGGSVGESGL